VSAQLEMELACEPVERVAAELAVAFRFDEDRPLRGPAGRADWRLCGDLSRFTAGADAHPGTGTDASGAARALLVPTEGRLRAERLLLLCLGSGARFAADDCARAVREAARRALDLHARSLAMGPPGHWLDRIPVGIGAQACVRGAVAALEGTRSSLEIRLVVPPEHAARVIRGLEAAAADMRDRGVSIALPRAERLAVPRAPAPRIPPSPHSSQA
jgi:hypothetical protein